MCLKAAQIYSNKNKMYFYEDTSNYIPFLLEPKYPWECVSFKNM